MKLYNGAGKGDAREKAAAYMEHCCCCGSLQYIALAHGN